MSDLEQARRLASRAVSLTEADQAEALVTAGRSALTRFANNRIHQSVAESDMGVSIRAVLGTRIGVASTNVTDDDSLAACCQAAVDAAKHAPEDPAFPGLPAPHTVASADRYASVLDELDAEHRATAARTIIEQSDAQGLTAAGKIEATDTAVAVANSVGVDTAQAFSSVSATVLSMGADECSGWASFTSGTADALSPSALGDTATRLALRSTRPKTLDPGEYTVVLAPEAVAELVTTLGYLGFSAKSLDEGSSFVTGHIGEQIVSPLVTIVDDALAPFAIGLTFDYEGMPKRRTVLIDKGVAKGSVTDSYWAAKTDSPNTGHALPAPNSHGPLPLHLEMEAGDTTIDEMIASVDKGIYVTRFHYVNIEHPVAALLTGMTRDGTFVIESGRITHPVKNLRFTQGAVTALKNVRAVGKDRETVDAMLGPIHVPALLLDGFAFTGQTG